MMKRNLLLVFLFIIALGLRAQHNIMYSQYFFSGILINPAYAGSGSALDATALYRKQWTGVEGAPVDLSVAVHSPLRSSKVNVGLLYQQASFGLSRENHFDAMYAWRAPLSEGSIAFGVQAGVCARSDNWAAANTTTPDDPAFSQGIQRTVSAEMGAGAYYSAERFYVGLSSPILYRTFRDYSLADAPLFLSGGVVLKLNEDLNLKPAALLKYISHSPAELDLSATLFYRQLLGIGAGYRSGDAVFGFFDLSINQQMHLGYCYDYTISRLSAFSNGSHEIMLRYIFRYNVNVPSARYF